MDERRAEFWRAARLALAHNGWRSTQLWFDFYAPPNDELFDYQCELFSIHHRRIDAMHSRRMQQLARLERRTR